MSGRKNIHYTLGLFNYIFIFPTKPPKFPEINKSALGLSFLNGFNDNHDLSLIGTKQFPKLNLNLTSVKVEDQNAETYLGGEIYVQEKLFASTAICCHMAETICWQPCLVLKCCTVLTPKKRVGWV